METTEKRNQEAAMILRIIEALGELSWDMQGHVLRSLLRSHEKYAAKLSRDTEDLST